MSDLSQHAQVSRPGPAGQSYAPATPARADDRLGFWLAAAVVFLSPYNNIVLPNIYITGADILALASVVILAVTGRLSLDPFGRLTTIWLAAFALLATGMLVGSLVANRPLGAVVVLSQYSFAFLLLPLVICRRSYRDCSLLLLIFVATILIAVIHGAYVFNYVENPPRNIVSASGRLRTVLGRENGAAAMIATAAIVALYLCATRWLHPLLGAVIILTLIYGIVLTASNTGIMALVAGVATLSVLMRGYRGYLALLFCVGAGMLAFVIMGPEILPEKFSDRVLGAVSSGDIEQAGTFSDRVILMQEGWDLAREYAFIGLGADEFREINSYGQPVHNTYILLLVEGGVLSLGGLVAMLGLFLITGAILYADRETRDRAALVIAMGITYAVLLNAFAHVYARFWMVPLALTLAVGLSADAPHKRNRTDRPTRKA
ncbi:O-antigen ligase family protein [Palleronia rufa]|uniref:O-antigen ligase family protein n=1 Tax=Palleronia rufa TaxID=1530186 RepID=UPI00055C4789|nr:O-antigen ligase family protein [Palleronia rufa]